MTTEKVKQTIKFNQTGLVTRALIRGEAITSGSISVVPVSRRISVGLPGNPAKGFALIWQRPAALLITQGEQTRTIPIHDLTCLIILTLIGLSALGLWVLIRKLHVQPEP